MVSLETARMVTGLFRSGGPRNSKLYTWGYQEYSAGGLALLVAPTLCNPGDCQINDKTHFTSRPEVCSGEPKLIAYLILSHQSLIQASTNNSVLHFRSKGLMEWAFPRALVYREPLLRGTWPSWGCVAKVTGRLVSWGSGDSLLVLRNDGDMTTVTMMLTGET